MTTLIAILISTRNRAHVADWTHKMIARQTVGLERLWIVVVDGSPVAEPTVWCWADVYLSQPDIPLGGSRNLAINTALWEKENIGYLALWDDDDYYEPDHLERMIAALDADPTAEVVGASMTQLYYLREGLTLVAGPYCEGHALEPTLVFRASYLRDGPNRFLPDSRGLSAEILNGFTARLIQVWGTMAVICHGSNTYDKYQILGLPERWNARRLLAGEDVPAAVLGLESLFREGMWHPML
jgi:glycosyltransferase involved in cell wall biosynthesis